MPTGWEAWEAYFYPETYNPETRQGTLRNRYGERDAERLDVRERIAADARIAQLQNGQVRIEGSYGLDHLQALHRHIFQDTYEWAGEIRTVRMQKEPDPEISRSASDPLPEFARPRRGEVGELMNQVQEHVATVDWKALDRRGFVNNTAVVIAYTNQAHPFREGNGRATQAFIRQLSEQTGFRIDFSRIDRDAWNRASASTSPTPGREWIDPRPLIPLVDAATTTRSSTEGAQRQSPAPRLPAVSTYARNAEPPRPGEAVRPRPTDRPSPEAPRAPTERRGPEPPRQGGPRL